MAVHAAVRDQTHQVQRRPAPAAAGVDEHVVLEEPTRRDVVGDPDEILADDPAGAEVEMANLGVPLLAVRQADGAPDAASVECGQSAQIRSNTGVSARSTALPGPGGARPHPSSTTSDRPARSSGAAATIARNGSASRLAPPMSAPSMSGWASSSRRVLRLHAAAVLDPRSRLADAHPRAAPRMKACASCAISGVAVVPCRSPRSARRRWRLGDALGAAVRERRSHLARQQRLGLARLALGLGLADARRSRRGRRRARRRPSRPARRRSRRSAARRSEWPRMHVVAPGRAASARRSRR